MIVDVTMNKTEAAATVIATTTATMTTEAGAAVENAATNAVMGEATMTSDGGSCSQSLGPHHLIEVLGTEVKSL